MLREEPRLIRKVCDYSVDYYLSKGWTLVDVEPARPAASELEPKPGLAAIGIETIEQFAEASDEQLLGVRYITEKALAKYRKALEG
jgi:hypothetical protein